MVWEQKLIRESKYSTSYGAMVVSSTEDLPRLSEALKNLDSVSHVESILSFLPGQVESKQSLLAELKPLVTGISFAAPANPFGPSGTRLHPGTHPVQIVSSRGKRPGAGG